MVVVTMGEGGQSDSAKLESKGKGVEYRISMGDAEPLAKAEVLKIARKAVIRRRKYPNLGRFFVKSTKWRAAATPKIPLGENNNLT